MCNNYIICMRNTAGGRGNEWGREGPLLLAGVPAYRQQYRAPRPLLKEGKVTTEILNIKAW